MKKNILSFCFVLLTALPFIAQEIPDFDQYKIEVLEIKPKKVDFKSNAQAKKYRKFLLKANKGGVNFAGKYILASFKCGNHCADYAVIDAETGKVFFPEILQNVDLQSDKNSSDDSVQYKADSSLLKLKEYKTEDSGNSESSAITRYYEWDGTELKEVSVKNSSGFNTVKGVVSRVILPQFLSTLSGLETKTRVPILLPSEIPAPKFLPKMVPVEEGSSTLSLYLYINVVSDTEYDLSIDITPDCKSRPNCNYGHISGIKNSSATPVNTTSIEFDEQKAEQVNLVNNITGFYIPAPLNARATTGAVIIWLDGMGNQYSVSLKRAPKEDVVSMANSAISNFFIGK